MSTFTAGDTYAWIKRFAACVEERNADLTDLDRRAGDGDFGSNLRSALRHAETALGSRPADSPRLIFGSVSDAFLNTGGTSGPLFGMWFREFAKAVSDEMTTPALAAAATEGVRVVQRLGRAEVGHKTMVDAMVPAADALAAAVTRGAGVADALRHAAEAAHAGAMATEKLAARRGRASYLGDHARGVVDPGALTVALFFETGALAGDGVASGAGVRVDS